MATTEIEKLLEHMWWADREVHRSLSEGENLPARAVEIYAHVVGAELVWIDRLEGVEQSVAVWPDADVEQCRELAAASERRYRQLLSRLDREELEREVSYVNSAGRHFDSAVRDILIHVAMHGTYHRGQVSLLLRDGGSAPAPTDYIGWVRGVPAATRADSG